jgi:secreted PhoX family phosphatase
MKFGKRTQPSIGELIELRLSRRAALKGMGAAGALGLFGCGTAGVAPGSADGSAPFTFGEVGRSTDDKARVPAGYDLQVLIRHGDPIRRGGPQYRVAAQTPAEQEQQFGADNDFIAFMPLPRGSGSSARGLLGVNHENHRRHLVWPGLGGKDAASRMTRERVEVQMAAQGFSVIEIAKSAAAWRVIDDSPYNRRIHSSTETRASGPAAGSPRLRTRADPSGTRILGTFNNCAGGVSPWNTVLTTEENIQFYFTGDPGKGPEAAALKRYAISGRGGRYDPWGRFVERFHLEREPNEPNRFGWIVEIDPYDPKSTPVKRTALGRFAHECASTAVSHDGRVAVYSGDDARMEYVYKFVTRGKAGTTPDLLDEGTLYAARFEENGRMRWLPLVFGQGGLTPANGFRSQADVVIEARRAADVVGATPMDRPEDIEVHPATGRVYVVLTYNERRKPGEVNVANPRGPNKYGHIIEIVPPLAGGGPDHTSAECAWGFFLMAGDPRNPEHGARYASPVSADGWVAAPDNLAFDPKGRIWITTDGQDEAAGFNDSLYAAQVSGPNRGATRCFFVGPSGAEVSGPAFTPDGRTLFLSVQHPGNDEGSTFEKPSTRWPDFTDGVPPRSAVVAITRRDGGEIGG